MNMIQAAINGSRKDSIVPDTTARILEESMLSIQAGAVCIHFHVRDGFGQETLEDKWVNLQVMELKKKLVKVPIGISTGAWIEPDLERRIAQIRSWSCTPDFVSINFDEEGYELVAEVILEKGIAIEVGLNGVLAAKNFLNSKLADRCLRILIEPPDQNYALAYKTVEKIELLLDEVKIDTPRLLHGVDNTCWKMIKTAFAKNYHTRIGFEDTLFLSDHQKAKNNGELIKNAIKIKAAGNKP